jgi:hypothetical protein
MTSGRYIGKYSKATRRLIMPSWGEIPMRRTIDGFARHSRTGYRSFIFSVSRPGRYQAMLPTFISGWDGTALKACLAFGAPGHESLTPPETALERRYALRAVKQGLHQASFREAVISAYNARCALSGLPESVLLDAAHIIPDKDQRFGQPVIRNGIPLSKIHHAAFDAHLIGIDGDYGLHVSDRLVDQNDGPVLEALKLLHVEGSTSPAASRTFLTAIVWHCALNFSKQRFEPYSGDPD